ncbi:GNAT family N-acetyltransferase [Sphingobacterium faecium]|uniref:GNAT family N-acetyltransferase n=1 Tax=Sphingobacterium faecium TaxID=34087 RepID=UPI00246941B0|nr:GNAT family N-acetyltransferase [Sphingobacterium faecium]MDH5827078.1 GNAT family N-acetyltransferase [Sphingobacterium faecium]
MKIDQLYIEQVIASRTWKIRQEVLYPHGSLKDVMIDDDFEGTHFAATIEGVLVGVISVFEIDDGCYQFRKFAVLPNFQGYGIGTALLHAVFNFCRLWRASSLFCDARIGAVSFYEGFGMKIQSQSFFKKGLEYVRMKILLFDELT